MSRTGSVGSIKKTESGDNIGLPRRQSKEDEVPRDVILGRLAVPDGRQSGASGVTVLSTDESIYTVNPEDDDRVSPGDTLKVVDPLAADPSDEGSDANGRLPSRKKKTSKKMIFLWSLVSYCVICSLFFIFNAGVLIFTWFHKMHYFIREAGVVSIHEVIPNVFWILFRFLLSTLSHIVLCIFTILLLIGIRQTESLVVKHQEKVILWIFILACISEHSMLVGSGNHMGTQATVENGQAKDTLLPRVTETKPEFQKCFQVGIFDDGANTTRAHLEVNLIRANLKWMVQVSCGTTTVTRGSTLPTWKFVLQRILNPARVNDRACQDLVKKLEGDAASDCSIVHFLDNMIFTWLILEGLGIWFCVGLLYLYFKSVVRTNPGRFSFATSTYQEDMDKLRQVAETVRKLTERETEDIDKSPTPSEKVTKHSNRQPPLQALKRSSSR